jgi:hypothetical protein
MQVSGFGRSGELWRLELAPSVDGSFEAAEDVTASPPVMRHVAQARLAIRFNAGRVGAATTPGPAW